MKLKFCTLFLLLTLAQLNAQSIFDFLDKENFQSIDTNHLLPTHLTIENQLHPLFFSMESKRKQSPTQRLDSIIFKYRDSITNQFENSAKIDLNYNSQYSPTIIEVFKWIDIQNEWRHWYSINNAYDLQNNIVEYKHLTDYSLSSMTYKTVFRRQYTIVNQQVSEMLYSTSFNSSPFEDKQKVFYSYNSNNELVEVLCQDRLNSQWQNSGKEIYSYNNNQLVNVVDYYFQNGNWSIRRKTEYFYLNNEVNELFTSTFSNNSWTPENRYLYDYSPAGIVEEEEWQRFKTSNWVPIRLYERGFDSLQNIITEEFFDYDEINQSWISNSKEFHNYDLNYPYADLISHLEEDEMQYKRLKTEEGSNTNQWDKKSERIYYWTNLVTTSSEPLFSTKEKHIVSPNPAFNYLKFELPKSPKPATVELYNINGQRVISTTLTDNFLQLGDLPAGFYSYLVKQDGKAYSGKVIVE